MAASIESRVPFLDHKLVEFAARLPVRMKLRGLTTKYILRQAMRDRLPKAILTRKKMGFPVPVGAWLRGPFRHIVEEYVLSERTRARGIFNADYVQSLVTRHINGEKHDERLWALINFEIWQRRFLDGEANSKDLGQLHQMTSRLAVAAPKAAAVAANNALESLPSRQREESRPYKVAAGVAGNDKVVDAG